MQFDAAKFGAAVRELIDSMLKRVDERIMALESREEKSISQDEIIEAVALKFERRFSELSLNFVEKTHAAIAAMPTPKDGLPAEAISIEQNERELTITVGDSKKTIRIDSLIYRGVWAQGSFEKGDCVTYDGSLWVAQKETNEAPATCQDWKLAVKRGRNGKDLRDSASIVDKTSGVAL